MGIDWVRRTEEKFRHCLQEATGTGFNPAPLFPPDEKAIITYACRWLSEDRTVPIGTQLTIFQRTEKSRIAVLHGNEAVGEVLGKATEDLKQLFRRRPELCNALAVNVVRVGKSSEPFYVQPIMAAKKKAAGQ
jgi:hypothetical protein